MALRRGFKSEAERIADRERAKLGVGPDEPTDLPTLATLLGVEIRAGDDLIPRQRFADLERIQPGAFSSCTILPSPDRKVIIFNPLPSRSRQTSDIAHELAHVILDHDLSRIERLGGITFLTCDTAQEEEANWLSGCLLLPRPSLLVATRKGWDASTISEAYGVSEQMAQYRLNVTGVLRQYTARRNTSRSPR